MTVEVNFILDRAHAELLGKAPREVRLSAVTLVPLAVAFLARNFIV